ncbi:MAG: T9SS type A sorting domain-containing protein [Bacteroidia bacterium]
MLIIFAAATDCIAQNYYRSVATGNWNAISTWESSPTGVGGWVPAATTPTSADLAITIQSPNTVTINATVTIDEVTVNLGGSLTISGVITLTINNGVGIDLINNGTITDNLTTVGGTLTFSAGAKWSMSSGATLIKTTGSASNTWQTAYNGGVSTIPANSNWILRKTAGGSPVITTTAGGGAFYGNLTIENATAGNWITSGGSIFTGSTGFPTIKGNFDIGGSGIGTVNFSNAQTNGTPTRVIGNMLIRTGNTLSNSGTGIQFESNLTVNGTLSYTGTPKILFAGAIAQTIVIAPGILSVYNLEINKSANDVLVNKTFTVDGNANFIVGRFITSATYPITFGDLATASGYNNTSFVSGPCIKTGTNGFTYPIGKGNNVQPLGMSVGAAGLPPPFWTENFSALSGWSLANILGAEGSFPNFFQITDDEGGIAPPGCGVANNGNKTLHVTSVFNPAGGAAYLASSISMTNRRAESPLINCTGKSSITLSFNYIGNGQALLDNASLWYYDGSAWSVLNTSLKSPICVSGQGQWTNYSIVLPVSANNNPGIKIAFKWENNNDNAGTDPSFAVDDISLSSPVTESFSAEYFPVNPQSLFGNNLEPTLDHISYCEYWDLTRLTGITNRQVTLSWDNFSCGVTSMNDLRVARYDAGGNIWRDHGNNTGLLTGTTAAGTITSSLISTQYCPYTLASINLLNPLPVNLISFDAKAVNNYVDIKWVTLNEPFNHFFTIEKSKDTKDKNVVSVIAAKGNANAGASYNERDYEPYQGTSYYRLKQTDINGSSTYTEWKTVIFKKDIKQQLVIVANNGGIDFSITPCCENTSAHVKIFNTLGKLVFDEQIQLNTTNHLNLYNFSQGMYFLIVESDGVVLKEKFQY